MLHLLSKMHTCNLFLFLKERQTKIEEMIESVSVITVFAYLNIFIIFCICMGGPKAKLVLYLP